VSRKNFNIANIITSVRILSVPFLIYFAAAGKEKEFFYLWIFSVSTDVLDGWIARTFKMQTPLGAKLDSTADFFIYLTTIYGIYALKWDEFGPYKPAALIILFYFLFADLFSFVKFRKISSLHLYSWKIGGLLQFAFVFWLFYKGFNPLLFKIVFVWTGLAFLENIFIQIKMKKYVSNQKHILYFLKHREKERQTL